MKPDDIVQRILRELVERYGPFDSSDDDLRRCRGLLRDLAGAYTLQANLLLQALEISVPERLVSGQADLRLVAPRLVDEMRQTFGTSAENAKWAIDAWASVSDVQAEAERQRQSAIKRKQLESAIESERQARQTAEQQLATLNAELGRSHQVVDTLQAKLELAILEQKRLETEFKVEQEARLAAERRVAELSKGIRIGPLPAPIPLPDWVHGDDSRLKLIASATSISLVVSILLIFLGWRSTFSTEVYATPTIGLATLQSPEAQSSDPNAGSPAMSPITQTVAAPTATLDTPSSSNLPAPPTASRSITPSPPTATPTLTPSATVTPSPTPSPTVTPTPPPTATPTPFTFPTLVATCETLDGDAKDACRRGLIGTVVTWQGIVTNSGSDGKVSVELPGTEWYRKVTLDFGKSGAELDQGDEIMFTATIREFNPALGFTGLEVVLSDVKLLPVLPTATPSPPPTSTRTPTTTATATPTPTLTPTPTTTPPPTPFTYPTLVANFESLKEDALVQYLLGLIGAEVMWQGKVTEIDGNQVHVDVGRQSWDRRVILNFGDSGGELDLKKDDNVTFTATISKLQPGARILWYPFGIEVELTDVTLLVVSRPETKK